MNEINDHLLRKIKVEIVNMRLIPNLRFNVVKRGPQYSQVINYEPKA